MADPTGFRDLSGLANVGNPDVLPGHWPGMVKPGNINLLTRPIVRNPDGSISTVKSVSFGTGPGQETLMPEVVGGRVVSALAALAAFMRSGQNLGTFTNPAAANSYAEQLHREQMAHYLKAAG